MSETSKKRQKSSYYNFKKPKHASLEPGMKGFLLFCNFREKDCIKEAFNLLHEYLDQTKLVENKSITSEEQNLTENTSEKKNESDSEDIEEALANEIEATKNQNKQRSQFKVIESGAKNILFIRSALENDIELTLKIMKNTFETKEQKTRFLLRLVPIEVTCKANLTDIKENVTKLADNYFCSEAKSFSVIYNHRNNSNLNRDELIKEIATIIASKNEKNVVNLKNPDLAIIVEVIRNICLLAILPDYIKYKKFNLHQLCNKEEEKISIIEKTEGVVDVHKE